MSKVQIHEMSLVHEPVQSDQVVTSVWRSVPVEERLWSVCSTCRHMHRMILVKPRVKCECCKKAMEAQ